MTERKRPPGERISASGASSSPPKAYRFRVSLIRGRYGAGTPKEMSVHTIELVADASLAELHRAIAGEFGWKATEHHYVFSFGGRPGDLEGDCYSEIPEEGPRTERYRGWLRDSAGIRIRDLDLANGTRFSYWFDFAEDRIHSIEVVGSQFSPRRGKRPGPRK